MHFQQTYLIPRYFKYVGKTLPAIYFTIILFLIASHQCNAQNSTTVNPIITTLKLPRLIGDNMVLQRDKPVAVWGWAGNKERVTIVIEKEKYVTVADNNGNWKAELKPRAAGGPFTIDIKTAREALTLKNVMFGDVWLCSGQSNMQFEVKNVENSAQELLNANYPMIRLLRVGKTASERVEFDISSGKWQECNPKTVLDFSAVGYFFAKNLLKSINVPIGLIEGAYPGAQIETWMSADRLQNFPQKAERLKMIQGDPDYIQNKTKELKSAEQVWLRKFYTETGHIDSATNLIKRPDVENWIPVTLPGYINDQKIPVQFGISWYRKQFTLPDGPISKFWELNLGQITEVSLIYLNGHKLNESMSRGSENRVSVLPKYLKNGDNELLIYALNENGLTGFPGSTKLALNDRKNNNTISLSGQWYFKQQAVHDSKSKLGSRPTASVVSTDYTFLYNGMIGPITSYNLKGVIWYQGEANVDKPDEYEFLLRDLIKGWRSKWGISDMPFYIVQLPNYNGFASKQRALAWPRLQEVQKNIAFSTKNSGLAVTCDIGNNDNIHPKNKQDVGKRLALVVRNTLYKENSLVCYGPIFKHATQEKDSLLLSFEPSSSELVNSTGSSSLNNFLVAGADQVFYPAIALIRGKNVVVFSNQVPQPVYVRYAFNCAPADVNFYNKEGLPAVPFRTDNRKDW